MELMLILPLLLGAALLGLVFDDDGGGSNNTTPPPPPPPPGAFSGATELNPYGDIVNGTAGADMIKGLGGDDELSGGAGEDALFGGAGLDTLSGGAATDILAGGVGNDILLGGTQDDYLIADNGADTSYGGFGDDIVFGGFGGDHAFGGNGDDLVVGHRGEDLVRGGNGNDIVTGNMLYTGIFNANDAYAIENDAGINQISDIPRMGDLAQRDDLKEDEVFGDVGDDDLYIGDKDIATGGIGADDYFISPESGTSDSAEINGFVSGQDQIIVQYYGAAAPTITIGNDGGGNATVLADGVEVGLLNGAAGAVLASDITVEMIPLFTG